MMDRNAAVEVKNSAFSEPIEIGILLRDYLSGQSNSETASNAASGGEYSMRPALAAL
jgi:hypothetical protein